MKPLIFEKYDAAQPRVQPTAFGADERRVLS